MRKLFLIFLAAQVGLTGCGSDGGFHARVSKSVVPADPFITPKKAYPIPTSPTEKNPTPTPHTIGYLEVTNGELTKSPDNILVLKGTARLKTDDNTVRWTKHFELDGQLDVDDNAKLYPIGGDDKADLPIRARVTCISLTQINSCDEAIIDIFVQEKNVTHATQVIADLSLEEQKPSQSKNPKVDGSWQPTQPKSPEASSMETNRPRSAGQRPAFQPTAKLRAPKPDAKPQIPSMSGQSSKGSQNQAKTKSVQQTRVDRRANRNKVTSQGQRAQNPTSIQEMNATRAERRAKRSQPTPKNEANSQMAHEESKKPGLLTRIKGRISQFFSRNQKSESSEETSPQVMSESPTLGVPTAQESTPQINSAQEQKVRNQIESPTLQKTDENQTERPGLIRRLWNRVVGKSNDQVAISEQSTETFNPRVANQREAKRARSNQRPSNIGNRSKAITPSKNSGPSTDAAISKGLSHRPNVRPSSTTTSNVSEGPKVSTTTSQLKEPKIDNSLSGAAAIISQKAPQRPTQPQAITAPKIESQPQSPKLISQNSMTQRLDSTAEQNDIAHQNNKVNDYTDIEDSETEGVDPNERPSLYIGTLHQSSDELFETDRPKPLDSSDRPEPKPNRPDMPTYSDDSNGDRPKDQVIGHTNEGRIEKATGLKENMTENIRLFNSKRDRHFGSYDLVRVIQYLSKYQNSIAKFGKLSVNDMSKKTGGQVGGHASHRNGLDVDLAYPGGKSDYPFEPYVINGQVTSSFQTEKVWSVFKAADKTEQVDRIFVVQEIKNELCKEAKRRGELNSRGEGPAKELLRKIRPTPGHHAHYHLRILCGKNHPRCRQMTAPAPGSGCP